MEKTEVRELGGPIVRRLSFTVGEGKAGSAAGLPSFVPFFFSSIGMKARAAYVHGEKVCLDGMIGTRICQAVSSESVN